MKFIDTKGKVITKERFIQFRDWDKLTFGNAYFEIDNKGNYYLLDASKIHII